MVKIIGSFCISFLALFVLFSFLPVSGEAEIYTDTVRLHVIANSDSEEDQALKLLVRDALLSKVKSMNLSDSVNAREELESSLESLKNEAKGVVKSNGYSYPVEVELCEEKYPERVYEGFTLPSGTYMSLQVKIGNAEGKNWWCVLFPPLCQSTAEKREEAFVSAGFTGEQYEIITKPEKKSYRIKFKIVEILMDLFD